MQRTIVNPLFKDTVTFLKTSAETNGAYSQLEVTLRPQGGNLSHIHTAFEETFIAVKGILGLQLKEEVKFLKPGESYTVEKNEIHNFFNVGKKEITFRIIFEPGHEGMENTLRIAYGLAADGLTNKKGVPKNLFAAALIMEMSNSYPTGILASMKPLLSLLARRARKKEWKKYYFENIPGRLIMQTLQNNQIFLSMNSNLVETILGLTVFLSGLCGGVGFFIVTGGNPAIKNER